MPQSPNPDFTNDIYAYLHQFSTMNVDNLIRSLLGAAREPSGNGGGGHGDIIRVLNSISLCFIKTLNLQVSSRTKAIIFVSTPDNAIPEDDMNTDIRPDWYAYMTTYEVLKASVRDNVTPPSGSYYSIIGIGEQVSRGSNAVGKIMHYLHVLCKYRFDLRTVYGFQYDHLKYEGRHWSYNACGWAYSDWLESDPQPTTAAEDTQVDSLLPWVQHVLFLYSSDHSRIGHVARGNHVGVHLWTVEEKTFIVMPFHASSGPGRMTVVFIILLNIQANHIVGIFKRQWRDKSGRFIEGNLLRLAQGLHWYPCYPDLSSLDPIGTYEISQYGYDVSRALSFLDMKTSGSPLTSCEDTKELLMTAYDAILAHWLLYKKRGILHRDISSSNILYKPQHHLTTQELEERKQRRQPFRKPIKEILEGSEDEWCALLTDLDQAVIYEEWCEPGHESRLELTGTPMFIAVEKSSLVEREIPNRDFGDLEALSDKLSQVQVNHPAIFQLAFPSAEENEVFDANFREVLNRESVPRKPRDKSTPLRAKLNPNQRHQAYHDVESLFWVFLWRFARAHPEGYSSEPHMAYNQFCDAMLYHTIGEQKDRRFTYLFRLRDYMPDIFHPKLERFSELFLNMAEYLSIPWSRYEDLNLPDDHTHLAMLRLLLGAILEENGPDRPTQLANKVRYLESVFPTKEVRVNSKSQSKSQSIPHTQATNLGTIPEISSQTGGAGDAKTYATSPNASDGGPNTPKEPKILLPPPPNVQRFLNRFAEFRHERTSALPDKDVSKPSHRSANSAKSSMNNEDPFIDTRTQRVSNKRQARPMDKKQSKKVQGEPPSKKSKSAE